MTNVYQAYNTPRYSSHPLISIPRKIFFPNDQYQEQNYLGLKYGPLTPATIACVNQQINNSNEYKPSDLTKCTTITQVVPSSVLKYDPYELSEGRLPLPGY